MKSELSKYQIEFYRENGYIVIEDFLDNSELDLWRDSVEEALIERNGQKMPGKAVKVGDEDGINSDADYFKNVFDQLLNLWQTNDKVKELILDPRIGKLATELSGADGIRVWHDQALIKRPWANPTSWHLDTPFWSFSDRRALSIWIALDDVTLENGSMFFIPGSHKETTFDASNIGKNMGEIFEFYPQFRQARSVPAVMKAGSCSFHNGLTIHGAHANMTSGFRRAMTCAFMPDGSTFNGKENILPEAYLKTLKEGDLLNNDNQNPLLYSLEK